MPTHRRAPLPVWTIALLLVAIAALFLVLAADDAEASGNGDYPPPASGTWYINQATNVWSERIELRGSVYIYAPLSMNLVNLTFNCTSNLQYELYVASSGSLTFTNGNITAANLSNHYRFRAYGPTTIRNSELSEAYYGLEVVTKQFTLTDCRIVDMYNYGVYMSLAYTLTGNVVISGNEFIANRNYGIVVYQYASVDRVDFDAVMTGDITIRDNVFRDNIGGGIYAYRYMYAYYSQEARMFSNLTIEGNDMRANRGYSIYVYTRLYNYQGGDLGKITYRGSINVNNNTVRDNSGYYSVYYFNDIDVYYGSDAIIESDINMVGNVITGNKDAYSIYFNNNIYAYYGRDAKVRVNLRMEANNISDNGGHGVYVNSVTNTNHGDKGICTNDGDILFKDNIIRDNLGSGVYFYRYSYSSYSAFSSISGNTTFTGNDIRNNQGYGGAYLYSYAYKYAGDPSGTATIFGTVRFAGNTFIGNLGYGAYVLRYTRTYYGSDSAIRGDVTFDTNTINQNTGYGGYVYYDAYKEEGGTSGKASIVSNATFSGNTMSGNSGYHGFYYYKRALSEKSSFSTINGTVTADGNTIEDNKGYGIYIYAYSYNNQGTVGKAFITGDIWVRDNTIRRNNGGGVYLYCYSSSYLAKSADIYQNITFYKNTVSNNGYSGFVVSVNAYSNRAVEGDTHVVGDIVYRENVVNANQNYGIYFYRYASSYYTDATRVYVKGDMLFDDNEINSNTYYGVYMINYVYNYQGGLAGHCELDSDYIVRNNTVEFNRYWAAMYLYRRVYAYQTGTAVLNSDLVMEDNTVTGNWGTGVYLLDLSDQYFYGGAGNPDRGNFTHRGRIDIRRNQIDTNAGNGLWLNSTVNAENRTIEAAPMIVDNSISYNGGDVGLYCDLRDVTRTITIERNTMEHNEVQYVALISNSGTAPDLLFRDNDIRWNKVDYTTLGLVVGAGDFNAMVTGNNISYNDASQNILALVSSGRIRVERNELVGNTNGTDVLRMHGAINTSDFTVAENQVRGNSGNGINVHTMGKVTIDDNDVRSNGGSGIIVTTDVTVELSEVTTTITDNEVRSNGDNGIWTVGVGSVRIERNTLTGNKGAGVRINAMKEVPTLRNNAIEANKRGIYLAGDKLAPLTTVYTVQDQVVKDSTFEGIYVEDLTVQLRSCTITGSGTADLAVRRARIDCYSTTVGYASGHVYETGHIKVWWRVDIDVKWQNGVPVPAAHVLLASDYDNRTYREFDTDAFGHIDTFNIEEWSMVDEAVFRWSPYRCTASLRTESSTQVEKVNASRNILLILRDTHVPAVAITSLVEGALLNNSIVRVAGTASDGGSGLVTVRVRLDAGQWEDLGKRNSFSKLLTVPDGHHTITVQAEDVAGMLGNASVNLTVDTLPPRLEVLFPEEGALTNRTTITVTGRALEGDLEVWVGTEPQSLGPDGSFSQVMRLYEGPNIVRVRAKDLAGNRRVIERNVTLDTIPPALAIDSPPDHFLTSDPNVTVVGRSEGGAEVSIGTAVATAGPGGAFSIAVALAEGENTLAVIARDAAGNTATVYRHARLDTIPPSVTIEQPEDGLLTRDDKVRVAGTVEEEDGLVLSVGGSFVLPVGGRYEYTVAITEGVNTITVTAQDAAGNEAEVSVKVIRRTQPPRLEILEPAYDYMVTNQVRFTIRGVTDPDVTVRVQGTVVEVDGDGNFSAPVDLKSGENVIAIRASDDLGNVADAAVRLILDTEPPSVLIEWPIDGYRTEDDHVNVSGRADVGTTLTVNGVEVELDEMGRYSHRLGLKMGGQNVTVVATDEAGNSAKAGIWVERYREEEPFKPEVPSTTTGSAGILLAVLLVAVALVAVAYIYLQRRRRTLEPPPTK